MSKVTPVSPTTFATKYCRLCSKELKHGVWIFGSEGKRLGIPDKIRKSVQILVLEEDTLPKKICIYCCEKLEAFTNFRETAKKSQEKLKSISKVLEKDEEEPGRGHDAVEDVTDSPPNLSSPPSVDHNDIHDDPEPEEPLPLSPIKESSGSTSSSGAPIIVKTSSPVKRSPKTVGSPGGNEEEPSSTTKPTWSCPQCSKILFSPTGYHNHMQTHSGRRFQCTHEGCGLTYTQKASLELHTKLHHSKGSKTLPCESCPKSFVNLKQLNLHRKIHAPPSQEYACGICKKNYRNGRLLNKHMKYHKVDKAFPCTFQGCSKSFLTSNKLNEHVNSHTGSKPVGCKFCEKRFNSRPNYIKHMRRKHPTHLQGNNKCPSPKMHEISVKAPDLAPHEPFQGQETPLLHQNPNSDGTPAYNWHEETHNNGNPHLQPHPSHSHQPPHASELGHNGPGTQGLLQNHQNDFNSTQIQSKPMELCYKDHQHCSGSTTNQSTTVSTANDGFGGPGTFQEMPMELTKVFSKDGPLELCVRHDLGPEVARISGICGLGQDPTCLGGKIDITERDFMDLSGAFRVPIDLISRTNEDGSHELCHASEGNLVDLSLRSTFSQDQSTSSFLRELIDLSASSNSFGGELDLTKHPQQQGVLQHPSSLNPHCSQAQVVSVHCNSSAPVNTFRPIHPQTSIQSVVYQEHMFNFQN